MMSMAVSLMGCETMKITLLYASTPRVVHERLVEVSEPCSLEEALELAGWLVQFPEIRDDALTLGVWGRKAQPSTLLRDGDRVEVYRALRVDPKVARRERFVGQGARSAGLFSTKRPGAKSGY